MYKIANNRICPVCGKKVQLIEIESSPEEGPGWGWSSYQVVCSNCGAQGPYEKYGQDEKQKQYAIDGWNKLIGAAKTADDGRSYTCTSMMY